MDYTFSQQELLTQALTHCSAGTPHNERLEFLGDALLDWWIAERLYVAFPDANEDELSRLRSRLVNKESLATLARELNLGAYLHLGAGELRNGGLGRDSILADAVEALLAAVYLDGGITAMNTVAARLYATRLAAIGSLRLLKDPKTGLQEWLQARHYDLPEYEVMCVVGNPHEQCFTVSCRVPQLAQETQGNGNSRRRAEQQAAQLMLEHLTMVI